MWRNNKTDDLTVQINKVTVVINEQQEKIKKLEEENQQLRSLWNGSSQRKTLLKEDFLKYTEEQKHRLWHMQYSYDNQLSSLTLENVEKRCSGNIQRLAGLKDIHKGKRCFIIGNGPSLRAEDLDKLQNELTFAVNKITEIFPYTKWRPSYYMVSDPIFLNHINEWTSEIIEKSCILMDSEFMKAIDEKYWEKIFWYYHNTRYSVIPEFSCNPDRMVYEGGSVLYIAVQFAVFMGITEIFLLGVDNNYKTKILEDGRKVIDFFEDNYFYKSNKQECQRLNLYCSSWMDFGENKMKNGTYDLNDMWNTVAYHCSIHKVSVLNATRGGSWKYFPGYPSKKLLTSQIEGNRKKDNRYECPKNKRN